MSRTTRRPLPARAARLALEVVGALATLALNALVLAETAARQTSASTSAHARTGNDTHR
jgi:hypothetical protein